MKTIIASLKAQIEATKKSIEIHETAKKQLWRDIDTAVKNGESGKAIENLETLEEEASLELSKNVHKLNDLRHALVSVRSANGEDLFNIDTFAPELSC